MNKNRKCASLIQRSVAAATLPALLIGSMGSFAYANQTESATAQSTTPGALAGVMAATAQIHEVLIESQVGLNGEAVAVIDADDPFAPSKWEDKLLPDVTDYLNIRSTPSKKGKIVGRLRPNDLATIEEVDGDWYKIISGEVEGYVSSAYTFVGAEALEEAKILCKTYALCEVKTLNVRSKPDIDSAVIGTVNKNDILEVDDGFVSEEGWIKVLYNNTNGYINSEFVSLETGELGTAMTPEDIQKAEEEALKIRLESVQSAERPNVSYNSAVSATVDDETLLAALLMCEAGASYEGMLAVGGVVVNRLHSGYSDSIRGVIYQPGQFTPAGSGKVDRTIANGVTETARQAARDALSGIDITGGCKSFRAASSGHSGTNIGGNVFF